MIIAGAGQTECGLEISRDENFGFRLSFSGRHVSRHLSPAFPVPPLYRASFPHRIIIVFSPSSGEPKEYNHASTCPTNRFVFCHGGAGLPLIAILFSQIAIAQGPMEVQAVVCEPFGVGSIALNLPAEMLPEPLGLEGVGLGEKTGRVFYPALRTPAVANALKELLREDSPLTTGGPVRQEVGGILRGILNRPPRTTLYFLFRGSEPLELTIQARHRFPLTVMPRNMPAVHRRLLQAWWHDYAAPRVCCNRSPTIRRRWRPIWSAPWPGV